MPSGGVPVTNEGLQVPMDRIAKAAGIGNATLYPAHPHGPPAARHARPHRPPPRRLAPRPRLLLDAFRPTHAADPLPGTPVPAADLDETFTRVWEQ
ncbi:hypothetical protein [Kitasatospora sp. LaBMicrA B282]|uniref:hypothetical protein n=1 Tax=Kitasatospora sp. LaBMicrA B282 TaxID=3420949 RepID=UPI003D0DB1DB